MDARNMAAERRFVVDWRTAEAEALATVAAESTCNSVRKRRILIAGRWVVEVNARRYIFQIDFNYRVAVAYSDYDDHSCFDIHAAHCYYGCRVLTSRRRVGET